MQDEKGLYYYPVLTDKKLRMYVRLANEEIEFRMWNSEDPSLWDDHGWVPYSAVQQAAALYHEEDRDGRPPLHLYDIDVALRLLRDGLEDL